MRVPPSPRSATFLACAMPAALCGLAVAMQATDPSVPPQPDRGLGLYSPVGGYALMALAAAAIIGISLMPAKRGHQD